MVDGLVRVKNPNGYSRFQSPFPLPQHHLPVGIEADEDEEQDGEGEQRRAAIADEWQGDADHRRKPDGHAHIDDKVKEEHRRQSICIAPAEHAALPLSHRHNPEQQQQVNAQQHGRTHEAEAFTDCAKDKIGALLGHKIVARLRAFEQALAQYAARANGDLGLLYVVVGIFFLAALLLQIFGTLVFFGHVLADGAEDALYLVRLEHMPEKEGNAKPLYAHAQEAHQAHFDQQAAVAAHLPPDD